MHVCILYYIYNHHYPVCKAVYTKQLRITRAAREKQETKTASHNPKFKVITLLLLYWFGWNK